MNYTKLPEQIRCNYCYCVQDATNQTCIQCGTEFLTEAEKALLRWKDEAEVYAMQKAHEDAKGFLGGK